MADSTLDHANDEIATDWKNILAKYSEDYTDASNINGGGDASSSGAGEAQEQTNERDEKGRFVSRGNKAGDGAGDATGDNGAGRSSSSASSGNDNVGGGRQDEQKEVGSAYGEGGIQPEQKTVEAVETQADRDLAIPPSSWKPAAKVKWAALDPEIRAEITRRESDFLKGQHELLPDAQMGRNLRQVIDPYRHMIEAEGGTPERAVQSLLQTAALFRTGTPQQKQAALMQIVQQYGIQMPQAGEEQQYVQQQEFRDPRLDQFLAAQQREQEQREQQEIQSIQERINTWAIEIGANGQPIRPFYQNVYDDMLAIIPAIRSTNPRADILDVAQQAYDRAVWANPETRQLLQKQVADEAEAKRREENLRRAAEAKKAASVNVPRRAVTPAPSKPRSMEETIRETANALGLLS